MKSILRLFAPLALVLFISASMNAQTATMVADKSETKKCEAKKCDPAMCDLMVKAGLCTKEQAAKCQAKCSAKSTKVAAASMERGKAIQVASTPTIKKASCMKTCSSKSKPKAE